MMAYGRFEFVLIMSYSSYRHMPNIGRLSYDKPENDCMALGSWFLL